MSKQLKAPPMLLLLFLFQICQALKCRSEDGASDAELKRVARSCMRKISEDVQFSSNGGGYGTGLNSNYHYSQTGYHYNSNPQFYNNNNNNNYGQQNDFKSDYDPDGDSDEDSDTSNDANYNYNERNNGGVGGNNGHASSSSQQRNQERNYMQNNRKNENGNSGNGERSNSASNNGAHNGNNDAHRNNQRNTHSKPNNNYNGHSGSSTAQGRNMDNHKMDINRNNDTMYDSACVAHCFFGEMNMLNRDGYPDRHKVNYMLTKDIRDRELRNFYADTIQSCFRYLDSQRRYDKCHFSRELIHCMTEYGKANCDDWQDYKVMFN